MSDVKMADNKGSPALPYRTKIQNGGGSFSFQKIQAKKFVCAAGNFDGNQLVGDSKTHEVHHATSVNNEKSHEWLDGMTTSTYKIIVS